MYILVEEMIELDIESVTSNLEYSYSYEILFIDNSKTGKNISVFTNNLFKDYKVYDEFEKCYVLNLLDTIEFIKKYN
jgi:hypothetical protein